MCWFRKSAFSHYFRIVVQTVEMLNLVEISLENRETILEPD